MLIEALLVAIVVLFGAIFLLGGVSLLKGVASHLWELWGAYFAALRSQDWHTTTGKSVRAVVTYTTGRRGGRTYAPAIRYAYGAGGKSLVSERFAFDVPTGLGEEGLAAARALVQRFRAGTDVTVYYDPERPERATLDRSVPSVVGQTLAWLFGALLGGPTFIALGVHIVRGPFEDPPKLGEVPTLTAQLGGLATAVGVVLLLAGGVRAISKGERTARGLLRLLTSAKSVRLGDLREGELVAVAGCAEDPLDAGEEEAEVETGHSDPLELPFEDRRLVYYGVRMESFSRTCVSDFAIRDASGVAFVELREPEGVLAQSRRQRIEGVVEQWLDDLRDDPEDPVPAYPESLEFRRIREGDSVLVVGRVERDEDEELVFRGREGDATALRVAEGSRDEVVAWLGKGLRRTRALLLAGSGLVVVGAVAMVV